MFFFNRKLQGVENRGMDMLFDTNRLLKSRLDKDFSCVIPITGKDPTLRYLEGTSLLAQFTITALNSNPDLCGQYLHFSLRVLDNYIVMARAEIHKTEKAPTKAGTDTLEAIRFQPTPLSISPADRNSLKGGLVERGFAYHDQPVPLTNRLCCLCDACRASFMIQCYHAGMMDAQYFYSEDASETLFIASSLVPEIPLLTMPGDKPSLFNFARVPQAESRLPRPRNGSGRYLYLNPFRCPHCKAPYIDFTSKRQFRPYEALGCFLANHEPVFMQ